MTLRAIIDTLLNKQRKLFVTGCACLAITCGFVFAVVRGGTVDALYRTFTDSLLFALGIFTAGNGAVHLFDSKYGINTAPPDKS